MGRVAMKSPSILTKGQIKKIFLECDRDNNSLLTRDEIKKGFDRLGAVWPGYRAGKALKFADTDHDGVVSMEELEGLVQYAYELAYTN